MGHRNFKPPYTLENFSLQTCANPELANKSLVMFACVNQLKN